MAITSIIVNAGDDILAVHHNNLRADLLTGEITIAGVKTFTNGIILNDDSRIAVAKKLYYGAGNTYTIESPINEFSIVANGTLAGTFASTYLALPTGINLIIFPTQKVYYDNGSDTYRVESGANILQDHVGGALIVEMTATTFNVKQTCVLEATKELLFDGIGGHTKILQSSNDVMDFYTGASLVLTLNANQHAVLANRLYFKDHDGTDSRATMFEKIFFAGGGNAWNYGMQLSSPAYSGGANNDPVLYVKNTTLGEGITIELFANTLSTDALMRFYSRDQTAYVGSITTNAGGTAYNTSSDVRVKKDIVDTASSLNDLLKIKVRDFKYKKSDKKLTGYIAQELFDIFPDAVTKHKNAEMMWGIDYGKLTPLIIKAIQDMKKSFDERISNLERG